MGGELGSMVIGWRDIVLLLVAAVAVYMAVVVVRMRRLKPPDMPQASLAEPLKETTGPANPPEVSEPLPEPHEVVVADVAAEEPPQDAPAYVQDTETEVVLLREEVDALRAEVAALRDELHHELAHLRATQTVSPLYSDAMQMATLGHDAATIAERCGISRAEAELMLALIKNQEQ